VPLTGANQDRFAEIVEAFLGGAWADAGH